jgi:hypothetical protein
MQFAQVCPLFGGPGRSLLSFGSWSRGLLGTIKMSRKIKTSISLFGFAGILLSSMSFTWAQQLDPTQPGAMYGYTVAPGTTGAQ